jgi:hypothetical protein
MSANTEQLREQSKQRTMEVLNQPGSINRFAPSPLGQINPALARSASFLAPGMVNPMASSFGYQRMPGTQYANYERMAPNVGGPLQAPMPPLGFVPAGTQPEVIRQYEDGSPIGGEVDLADATEDQILQNINETRIAQGQEPFESIEEFRADLQKNIGNIIGGEGGFNPFSGMSGIGGGIGMAEGGIASLEPQGMFLGGLMSAIGQGAAAAGGALAQGAGALGGAAAKGLGSLKDIALKGMQNYNENMAARSGGIGGLSGKRIEDMTREELIELIKTGKKPSGGLGADVKTIVGGITDFAKGRPPGGTAALNEMGDLSMLGYADGGDVEYPRMNGPISGPGTETSDDIPAMLSDGEFVVNAKAVRGIGRLEGAGKSKEEQRREGARMMYALQRAGEKAMRKA